MPTNPNPRLERILLLTWTVALAILVALQIGSIPPGLSWALLPYLALVARHLIAPTGRKTETPAETPGPAEPEVVAIPPDPGSEPIVSGPKLAPARPSAARPRRKARPRVVAEPAPAAWVEVAPGRFVREEHPGPTPPDEAPEASPPEPAEDVDPSEVAPDSAGQPAE